jgi:TRAP-type transport system small permease protein
MSTQSPSNSGPLGKGPQGPFLRALAAIIAALDWSGRIIAAACLSFLFVALLANVILRYAFGSGIAWAYEVHALLLPWLVAGGLVIAATRGRNIAITLLPELLGSSSQRRLLLATHAAVLVISIGVLDSSQPILKAAQFQTLSTLGIKQIWGYSSLVYAFGAMAINAAINILLILKGVDVLDHDPEHASLS